MTAMLKRIVGKVYCAGSNECPIMSLQYTNAPACELANWLQMYAIDCPREVANKWLACKSLYGAFKYAARPTSYTHGSKAAKFSAMTCLKPTNGVPNQQFHGCEECARPGEILFKKEGQNVTFYI